MRYSVVFLLVAAALQVLAQGSPVGPSSGSVTVLVRVADSLGAPIPDADVAVVRGTSKAVANGTTNALGRTRLTIPADASPQQLIVRKIGFDRAYRFFSIAGRDSVSIDMRLTRTVTTLAPVTISEKEDLKRKSYHLDADDILNSSRPIFDAADIFKLRPDMLNSRGGFKACEVPSTPRDGWIESVWVNGRRITLVPIDSEFIRAQKSALAINQGVPRPVISRGSVRFVPPRPLSHVDSVLSILHTIRPEHIAEITYHDCFDMSINANHSDMAVFIALKPGIGYKSGVGTYVMIDSLPAPSIPVGDLPRYAQSSPRRLSRFHADRSDLPGRYCSSDLHDRAKTASRRAFRALYSGV